MEELVPKRKMAPPPGMLPVHSDRCNYLPSHQHGAQVPRPVHEVHGNWKLDEDCGEIGWWTGKLKVVVDPPG